MAAHKPRTSVARKDFARRSPSCGASSWSIRCWCRERSPVRACRSCLRAARSPAPSGSCRDTRAPRGRARPNIPERTSACRPRASRDAARAAGARVRRWRSARRAFADGGFGIEAQLLPQVDVMAAPPAVQRGQVMGGHDGQRVARCSRRARRTRRSSARTAPPCSDRRRTAAAHAGSRRGRRRDPRPPPGTALRWLSSATTPSRSSSG